MKEFLGESHRARHAAKLEKTQEMVDVEIFDQMIEDVHQTNEDARERLKDVYPLVYELLVHAEQGEATSGEYAEFRRYKNSEDEPEVAALLNAALLPDLLSQLRESMTDYVSAIHHSEAYKMTNDGFKEADVLDEISTRDKGRTLSHNALIAQLQAFERAAQRAGIDTSWKSVIQLSEETFDRTRIQHFAEHVVDHLARIGMRA